MAPGEYTADELNALVERLPSGEGWKLINGVENERIPVLGDDITLESYIKQCWFFQMRQDEPAMMCLPLYIPKDILEHLGSYKEWIMLAQAMKPAALKPFVVFRNTPVAVNGKELYLADVRMGFSQGIRWMG